MSVAIQYSGLKCVFQLSLLNLKDLACCSRVSNMWYTILVKLGYRATTYLDMTLFWNTARYEHGMLVSGFTGYSNGYDAWFCDVFFQNPKRLKHLVIGDDDPLLTMVCNNMRLECIEIPRSSPRFLHVCRMPESLMLDDVPRFVCCPRTFPEVKYLSLNAMGSVSTTDDEQKELKYLSRWFPRLEDFRILENGDIRIVSNCIRAFPNLKGLSIAIDWGNPFGERRSWKLMDVRHIMDYPSEPSKLKSITLITDFICNSIEENQMSLKKQVEFMIAPLFVYIGKCQEMKLLKSTLSVITERSSSPQDVDEANVQWISEMADEDNAIHNMQDMSWRDIPAYIDCKLKTQLN